jgi:hypothetical protein
MATTEEQETRLAQAEAALHKLLTGSQAERVDYEGYSVTYTKTNIGDLRAYILSLEVALGIRTGRTKAILPRF